MIDTDLITKNNNNAWSCHQHDSVLNEQRRRSDTTGNHKPADEIRLMAAVATMLVVLVAIFGLFWTTSQQHQAQYAELASKFAVQKQEYEALRIQHAETETRIQELAFRFAVQMQERDKERAFFVETLKEIQKQQQQTEPSYSILGRFRGDGLSLTSILAKMIDWFLG